MSGAINKDLLTPPCSQSPISLWATLWPPGLLMQVLVSCPGCSGGS